MANHAKSTCPGFDPLQDRTQSACQQAVGALEAVGTIDAGKQTPQRLNSATCEFSTTGTGAAVQGNVLHVKIDPKQSRRPRAASPAPAAERAGL